MERTKRQLSRAKYFMGKAVKRRKQKDAERYEGRYKDMGGGVYIRSQW